MANKSTVYLQADEIDHITIRYTDYNESLNKKESIKKILFYNTVYKEVESALSGKQISKAELEKLDDAQLYDILVRIRTVLLGSVLESV